MKTALLVVLGSVVGFFFARTNHEAAMWVYVALFPLAAIAMKWTGTVAWFAPIPAGIIGMILMAIGHILRIPK